MFKRICLDARNSVPFTLQSLSNLSEPLSQYHHGLAIFVCIQRFHEALYRDDKSKSPVESCRLETEPNTARVCRWVARVLES